MCSKYLVLLWLAISILHLDLKFYSIYKIDLWLWIISTRVLHNQNYWCYLIGPWMIFFFFLFCWTEDTKRASTLNLDGTIWQLTDCYLEFLSFDWVMVILCWLYPNIYPKKEKRIIPWCSGLNSPLPSGPPSY